MDYLEGRRVPGRSIERIGPGYCFIEVAEAVAVGIGVIRETGGKQEGVRGEVWKGDFIALEVSICVGLSDDCFAVV